MALFPHYEANPATVRGIATTVDELNARYATAAANGFYVNADNYYNHGATLTVQQRDQQYHTAVANAASSLKSSLVAEEAKLRADLDTGADVVAAILKKGPSNSAALVLAMNGELPAQASITFPDVLKDFKSVFDPTAGAYSLVDMGRSGVNTFKSQLGLERASLALLQGKNLADAQTQAVLRVVGGDVTDARVLNQFFRGEESLNPLKAALGTAETTRSGLGLVDAAAATSKFAKGVSVLAVAGGIYDIGWNPNGDTGGRRALGVTADVTGIVGGGGSLLIAAGVITAPIAAPIVLGATAIAGTIALGMLIHDHWGDITKGVSTAYNWTADKVGDAVDAAGDTVDKAAGWVDDQAKKLPIIGGLF